MSTLFYEKDRGLFPSLTQPNKSLGPKLVPAQPAKPKAPAPTYTPPQKQTSGAPFLTEQQKQNFAQHGYYNAPRATAPAASAPRVLSAAEIKAQQDAALLAQRKGEVNPLLDRYNSMFDGLYGRINTAAADQANTIRDNYGEQRTSLTEDYNIQVPQIDMSYYLSGVGDSSLRLRGQGQAEKAFTNAVGQVKKNEEADLAQVGQSRAATEARYRADQAGIEDIRKQISESTNPDEILTLRNSLMTKIRGLEADHANFDTAEGFRGSLQKAAPVKDLAPIKSTLDTLMKGAAHPALKNQIAQQIIGSAGVSKEQQDDLFKQYVKG